MLDFWKMEELWSLFCSDSKLLIEISNAFFISSALCDIILPSEEHENSHANRISMDKTIYMPLLGISGNSEDFAFQMKAFFFSVDWSEPFLILSFLVFLILLVGIILSRKNLTTQTLFLALLGMIDCKFKFSPKNKVTTMFLAESINKSASEYHHLFSSVCSLCVILLILTFR
jgi:hypothetical protein